jgi:uncharacterized membrane protein YdjX (TVP38/TMEM64 family)
VRGAIIAAVALVAAGIALAVLPVREGVVAGLEASRGSPFLIGAFFAIATTCLVPFWVLAIGTGFVLGPWVGAAVAFAGNLSGGVLAWLAARTVARGPVESAMGKRPKLAALVRAARERGFLLVLLTRVSPLIPSNTMNWFFGAGGVSMRSFACGSALGMLPTLAAYVWLGTTLQSLRDVATRDLGTTPLERAFLIGGVIVTIAVTAWVAWAARRAIRSG